MNQYLKPTYFINADHPVVLAYVNKHTQPEWNQEQNAIALYQAVRDEIYYDPYDITLTPEVFQAHRVLEKGRGFCIDKAVLLAATLRAIGIPARLGFADVKIT